MNEYPRMCMDGHEEIGFFQTGEAVRCPVCRVTAEKDSEQEVIKEALLRADELIDHADFNEMEGMARAFYSGFIGPVIQRIRAKEIVVR